MSKTATASTATTKSGDAPSMPHERPLSAAGVRARDYLLDAISRNHLQEELWAAPTPELHDGAASESKGPHTAEEVADRSEELHYSSDESDECEAWIDQLDDSDFQGIWTDILSTRNLSLPASLSQWWLSKKEDKDAPEEVEYDSYGNPLLYMQIGGQQVPRALLQILGNAGAAKNFLWRQTWKDNNKVRAMSRYPDRYNADGTKKKKKHRKKGHKTKGKKRTKHTAREEAEHDGHGHNDDGGGDDGGGDDDGNELHTLNEKAPGSAHHSLSELLPDTYLHPDRAEHASTAGTAIDDEIHDSNASDDEPEMEKENKTETDTEMNGAEEELDRYPAYSPLSPTVDVEESSFFPISKVFLGVPETVPITNTRPVSFIAPDLYIIQRPSSSSIPGLDSSGSDTVVGLQPAARVPVPVPVPVPEAVQGSVSGLAPAGAHESLLPMGERVLSSSMYARTPSATSRCETAAVHSNINPKTQRLTYFPPHPSWNDNHAHEPNEEDMALALYPVLPPKHRRSPHRVAGTAQKRSDRELTSKEILAKHLRCTDSGSDGSNNGDDADYYSDTGGLTMTKSEVSREAHSHADEDAIAKKLKRLQPYRRGRTYSGKMAGAGDQSEDDGCMALSYEEIRHNEMALYGAHFRKDQIVGAQDVPQPPLPLHHPIPIPMTTTENAESKTSLFTALTQRTEDTYVAGTARDSPSPLPLGVAGLISPPPPAYSATPGGAKLDFNLPDQSQKKVVGTQSVAGAAADYSLSLEKMSDYPSYFPSKSSAVNNTTSITSETGLSTGPEMEVADRSPLRNTTFALTTVNLGSGLLKKAEQEEANNENSESKQKPARNFPPVEIRDSVAVARETALSPRIYVPLDMKDPFQRGEYHYVPSSAVQRDTRVLHGTETGSFSPVRMPLPAGLGLSGPYATEDEIEVKEHRARAHTPALAKCHGLDSPSNARKPSINVNIYLGSVDSSAHHSHKDFEKDELRTDSYVLQQHRQQHVDTVAAVASVAKNPTTTYYIDTATATTSATATATAAATVTVTTPATEDKERRVTKEKEDLLLARALAYASNNHEFSLMSPCNSNVDVHTIAEAEDDVDEDEDEDEAGDAFPEVSQRHKLRDNAALRQRLLGLSGGNTNSTEGTRKSFRTSVLARPNTTMLLFERSKVEDNGGSATGGGPETLFLGGGALDIGGMAFNTTSRATSKMNLQSANLQSVAEKHRQSIRDSTVRAREVLIAKRGQRPSFVPHPPTAGIVHRRPTAWKPERPVDPPPSTPTGRRVRPKPIFITEEDDDVPLNFGFIQEIDDDDDDEDSALSTLIVEKNSMRELFVPLLVEQAGLRVGKTVTGFTEARDAVQTRKTSLIFGHSKRLYEYVMVSFAVILYDSVSDEQSDRYNREILEEQKLHEFLLDFKRKNAEADGDETFQQGKVKWSVTYLHRMRAVLECLHDLKLSAGARALVVYGVPTEIPLEIRELWVDALENYGFGIVYGELSLQDLQQILSVSEDVVL